MRHYYAVVCLPHISAGGGGIKRIVKMTNDALCFCLFWRKNMHSVASLWCVTQKKKHLLKCGWNREATCVCVQPTLATQVSQSLVSFRILLNKAFP